MFRLVPQFVGVTVDRPEHVAMVRAIEMEANDCASSVVRSVMVTTDAKDAFSDADCIVLLNDDWQVSRE